MIANRLESKIFWLVIIPLILCFTALLIIGIDKETRELFKQEGRKLGILSRAMSQGITNSLRQEGPHRLRGLVRDFRHLGEVKTLAILTPEGRYGLVDELGPVRKPSPESEGRIAQESGSTPIAPIAEHPAFKAVVASKAPRNFQQLVDGQPRYTALMPLLNESRCQKCHTGGKAVVGVLQVSTSLEETIGEIHKIKYRLILSSVLSVFIIGAILRWLLKVFILRPIKEVADTIRQVAAGDLTRQVRVDSKDELGELATDFNRMAASLRRSQEELREWNIRLDQEVKHQTADLKAANLKLETQQERIRRDLKLAEKVQTNLIPHPLVMDGLEVGVTYIPHLEIGGDAAEILALDDHRAFVACFDVTGHGIAAALVSNSIQGEVRRLMRDGASPGEILVRLNRFITRGFLGTGMFASFVCGCFDLEAGTLTYAGGAHPAPLHWRAAEERVVPLLSSGRLLGVFEEMDEPALLETTVPLGPGDRVVFYTDGVVEVADDARTMLGEEGLEAIVAQHGAKAPEDLMAVILKSIAEYNASESFRDDVLLMVAGVRNDASFGTNS
ncbi:MAG: SpoIIE family protein phosphatase [bacterium]|nr:SpoIIE family protein phosphatase [bacterium]